MADYDGDGKPDLIGIANYWTGSGQVEVHVLSGASNYQTSELDAATPWPQTTNPPNWQFTMADYDGDGIPDLVGILYRGSGTGDVEVHILSGASKYQQPLLDAATAWPESWSQGNWI